MAEKDVLEARLQGIVDSFEARLNAMDRAMELSQQWPTELEKRIGQLKELLEAKLETVKTTIAERDRLLTERTELLQRLFQKQHEANKELLQQQHGASQKAIEKAEDSMRAQLVKVEELNQTYNESLSTRIASVSDSVASLANQIKGASLLWGFLIGGAGLVIVLLGFIYSMQ